MVGLDTREFRDCFIARSRFEDDLDFRCGSRFRFDALTSFGVAEDGVEGRAGLEDTVDEGVSGYIPFGDDFAVEGGVSAEDGVREHRIQVHKALVGVRNEIFGFDVRCYDGTELCGEVECFDTRVGCFKDMGKLLLWAVKIDLIELLPNRVIRRYVTS